jgi:hypothetical protein
MFTEEYSNPSVVEQMEEHFPEMAAEFKKICREQYEVFCAKQLNYGRGNIMLGGDIDNMADRKMAMAGIAIRLADKSNRLLNLLVKNAQDTVGESAVDTLQDMSNYAIIGQVVSRLKWK